MAICVLLSVPSVCPCGCRPDVNPKQLNERTRSCPHDVKAWVDFVVLQDDVGSLARGGGVSVTATVEKKLSILQRALEYNPDSNELLQMYLKEAARIWEYVAAIRQYQYHRSADIGLDSYTCTDIGSYTLQT